MSARNNNRVTPVVVEVRPGDVPTKSSKVHFAEETLIKQDARRLSPIEAWSLYHYEIHARACRVCHRRSKSDPDRHCETGRGLAQDLAEHIYYKAGEVYSTATENQKHVRVQLEDGYDQTLLLIRARARASSPSGPVARPVRRAHAVPVVSYDGPLVEENDDDDDDYLPSRRDHKSRTVTIEPSHTSPRSRTKHRSSRYATVPALDDIVENPLSPADTSFAVVDAHRRGSLYARDMERQRREAYKVEVREPAGSERRRRRHHHHRHRDDEDKYYV